jgi:hypothetical protein
MPFFRTWNIDFLNTVFRWRHQMRQPSSHLLHDSGLPGGEPLSENGETDFAKME